MPFGGGCSILAFASRGSLPLGGGKHGRGPARTRQPPGGSAAPRGGGAGARATTRIEPGFPLCREHREWARRAVRGLAGCDGVGHGYRSSWVALGAKADTIPLARGDEQRVVGRVQGVVRLRLGMQVTDRPIEVVVLGYLTGEF